MLYIVGNVVLLNKELCDILAAVLIIISQCRFLIPVLHCSTVSC